MENNRKEIEELAKDLRENYSYEKCPEWGCSRCQYEKYGIGYFCKNMYQAEKLYSLGYRKLSKEKIKNKINTNKKFL